MHVKSRREWEADRDPILLALREFAARMRNAPFANREGLRGVSAFALYWFLTRLQPTLVFEVGVWRGFSTWLIEQAAPDADLHCFDPIVALRPYLRRWKIGRTYQSRRAHYSHQDFSCAPVRELVSAHARPVAFFDDHQNKLPRVRQCRAAGIRDIIFDDNIRGVGTHRSLEDELADPAHRGDVEREIERYEVFPALWPLDFRIAHLHIRDEGLGFPIDAELRPIHAERKWHSSVTYVRLAPEADPTMVDGGDRAWKH